jgi:glycosyltransferase involved in cell wall biosynthesis
MPPRIKLLLLIPHLGGGGAERVTANLARWLDPARFDVHLVLCTADGPGAHAEELPESVTLHRIGATRVRYSWLAILRLAWSLRPDAILSNMAHLNFMVLALRPALPADSRILVRQNATASAAAIARRTRLAYRLLYPRADAILCQSRAMAADLHDRFGIPDSRLAVVPNPIDIGQIRAACRAAHSLSNWDKHAWPRLLSIGRLSHEKGFDLLLRALPSILQRYPLAQLAILGAGPEENTLRQLSRELAVSENLDLPGYSSSPADWLAGTTLYIQPSRLEGLPNALLEAAAAGLPLVATPSSEGVRELLNGAPYVWLTSQSTAPDLSHSILAALSELSSRASPPFRVEHAFLAPFEAKSATAATASIIEAVLASGTVLREMQAVVEKSQ